MKRTPTSELDKVFTYAESSYASDAPDLVFSSLKRDESILSEESQLKIPHDSIVRKTIGLPLLVLPTNRRLPTVLATRDFEYLIKQLDSAPHSLKVVIVDEQGITQVVRPAHIYDSCHLPHKLILGCAECVGDKDTVDHCYPKTAVLDYEDSGLDIDDLEKWKHRHITISGFTYISPMLTAPKNIAKRVRTLDEHDFNYVRERSEIRSDAMKERRRRERFANQQCSRCLIKTQCWGYQHRSSWGGCEGPLLYTEEEAQDIILAKTKIPFTDKELYYLANNSGPLKKRYNRYNHVASLYVDRFNTLRFGLRRPSDQTSEVVEVLDKFKDAKKFLEEYGKESADFTDNRWNRKLSKQEKAIFCLLGQLEESPWRTVAFHGHLTFPVSYIARVWDCIEQHFSTSRGRPYWYTRKLECIADIGRYDWEIPYLERTNVEDGYSPRW